jgi:UDP-N-acetylmuramoyl-tripeptide--D-alanyl-D-alanine ligase
MLELGLNENDFHADAGKIAASSGIDVLITAGPRSQHMAAAARKAGMQHIHEAKDSQEAATIAAQLVQAGDIVLVKGSRGMKMERVVQGLRDK